MVEPAFGLLRTRINELLMGAQAPPARSTGAEVFEANPKSLTGSLLRNREDSAVDGIGGFATVRHGRIARLSSVSWRARGSAGPTPRSATNPLS